MSISRNSLRSARFDPIALSFKNRRLELHFTLFNLAVLRTRARIGLLLGAVLYGSYGMLDAWFVPAESLSTVWHIRLIVVCLVLLVFGLTFFKLFKRHNQLLLAITGLIGGAGLLAKMWLLPDAAIGYYYAGLILITFWCHYFVGIRFIYATVVGLLIFAAFNLLFLWLRDFPLLSMASYDFFLVAANLIAASSSYMMEQQDRNLFLREKELDAERRLQLDRALHDWLTGLPNRELLVDRLEQAISQSQRNKYQSAGFFLDLDGFKAINDAYGHDVGDLVLQEVAARLKRVMRETDTLSRFGGDEFFILAQQIQQQETAKSFAEKLLWQIEQPINIAGVPSISDLSASIGICIFPYPSVTAGDIIRRADQAMYQVKRLGKGAVAFA